MKRIFIIYMLLTLFVVGSTEDISTSNIKEILIINSYSGGFVWSDTITKEIFKLFSKDYKVNIEYMASYKNTKKNFYKYMVDKYENKAFDMIITVDDDALDFVHEYYNKLYFNTPVFFTGINNKSIINQLDKRMFTGVFEDLYIRDNLELIKKMDKTVDKIYIINDPVKGKIIKKAFKEIEKDYPNFTFYYLEKFDNDFFDILSTLPQNSFIIHGYPLYHTFDYSIQEYASSIDKYAVRPIISLWDYIYEGSNLIGGRMASAEEQGLLLNNLITRYLNGTKIEDIGYITNMEEGYTFDFNVLKKFGYSIWSLPKNSIIKNQSIYNYKRFKEAIYILVIALILLGSLIFILTKEYLIIKVLIKKNNESTEVLAKMNEKLIEKNMNLKNTFEENSRLLEQVDMLLESTINLFRHKNEEEFMYNILKLLFDFIPEMVFSYSFIQYEKYEEFLLGTKDKLQRETIDFHGFPYRKEDLFEIFKLKYHEVFEEYEAKKCLVIPLTSQNKDYGKIFLCLDHVDQVHDTYINKLISHFESLINIFLTLSERNAEVLNSYKGFALKLAKIAEAHDMDTGNHVLRVGALAGYLAEKMGLEERKVEEIENFAPLHDIGKIYIPLSILKKKGGLTEDEWEIMKTHTLKSKELLDNDPRFETALNIALYHHEKYDGSGYPYGLKGSQIPIEAGIVAFVDVYDALRSKRDYKDGFSHEKTMNIILKGDNRTKPSHFLPEILEVITKYSDDIGRFWEKINDTN